MPAVVPPRIAPALAARVVPAGLHRALSASAWSRADTGDAQIAAALALVGAADPLAGHLAGLAILIDHHRHVTAELIRIGREDLIVDALAAFAVAWPELRGSGPRHVWRTIERLALYAPVLPPALVALLPVACDDAYPPTRAAAGTLAVRARVRDAIAAAVTSARHGHMRRVLAAIDAVAASEPRGIEDILARALAAWRDTRDPALVPWITLAARDCSRRRDPLVDAEQEAWLAVAIANDPADTPRLLDALFDGDLRRPARVAALGRRDLHPAYASVPELAPLLAGATPRPSPLVPDLARKLAGVARRWALLDEHARDPSDLALRAVLGDVLVEAGDPQGELIQLQLRGDEPHARQVFRRHAARLVGPLPGVDHGCCRFERGFLVSVRTSAHAAQMRAAADRVGWATVEELGLGVGPIPSHVPMLRVLDVGTIPALEDFARRGPHPRIEAIATWSAWLPTNGATFPNLKILAAAYRAADLATIAAAGMPIAVVKSAAYHLAEILDARATGPALLRITNDSQLVGGMDHPWRFEIARGANEAHARMPSVWHDSSQELLRELARHVRRIHVHADKYDQARLPSLDVGAELIATEHDVVLTSPTTCLPLR